MKPIITSILAALLCAAAPALAAQDEGKVVTVARDSITIGKKNPHTYTVTPATAISVNGMRAALPAVRTGMRASVVANGTAATSVAASEKSALEGASLQMKAKKTK